MKVLVVGDSHAKMWLNALVPIAEARNWELHAATVNACPWQYGLVYGNLARRERCIVGSDEAFGPVLDKLNPDVVILSARPYFDQKMILRDTGDVLEVGSEQHLESLRRGAAQRHPAAPPTRPGTYQRV